MHYINKDELLQKIDFVEFAKDIGIQLEQYNDTVEYKGFCPLKEHSSATLFVNKEKKVFYCFGCKHGGGMIKFIMLLNDVNAFQAVSFLYEYWKKPNLKQKENPVAIQFA